MTHAPVSPRTLVLLVVLSLASSAAARELVRVRVSQFTGTEPTVLDSTTRPDLFVLDAAVASAQLQVTNPAAPDKADDGPARFLPSLTPVPPALEAGRITLTVQPRPGVPVTPDAVHYRAAARFASNPSSLVLRWSVDDLRQALDVVDLSADSSRRIGLVAPPSDGAFALFWIAGNDFGANGGGEAGFADEDVVLFADSCAATPAAGCFEPGKGSVQLVQPSEARSTAAWSWSRGTVAQTDLGDPTTTTDYALCIYADGVLVSDRRIPGGGRCGSKPCWRPIGRGGFSYADPLGRSGGITRATLKPGAGKALASVRARGTNLVLPVPLTAAADAVVQLVRVDDGTCWTTVFPAPAVQSTDVVFRDATP